MRAVAGALIAAIAPCAGAQLSALEKLELEVRSCAYHTDDARAASCVRELVEELNKEAEAKKRSAEEKKRAAATAATKKKTAAMTEKDHAREIARAQLRDSYLQALERLSPGLNHIQVRIEGSKTDGALFGVHSFFTRYSLEIGRLGPGIQQWMDANDAKMRTACIYRVGVANKDGDGKVWYKVNYKAPC